MEIEIVPSLQCEDCNSYKVFMTDDGIECSECSQITAQTSDYIKSKTLKFKNLNQKLGDIL